MPGARHPKPYKDGPRGQITVPWKRRVLAKLDANKKSRVRPWNIEQLREILDAPKAGLNKLLKPESDQLTSKYADEITSLLQVTPPLVEQETDDEDFVRDVLLLRRLTTQQRADVMRIVAGLAKK